MRISLARPVTSDATTALVATCVAAASTSTNVMPLMTHSEGRESSSVPSIVATSVRKTSNFPSHRVVGASVQAGNGRMSFYVKDGRLSVTFQQEPRHSQCIVPQIIERNKQIGGRVHKRVRSTGSNTSGDEIGAYDRIAHLLVHGDSSSMALDARVNTLPTAGVILVDYASPLVNAKALSRPPTPARDQSKNTNAIKGGDDFIADATDAELCRS